MKALIYTEPKKIVCKQVEQPQAKKNEVLIQVKSVGICGSDMHAYNGHDERRPAPLILGHEVAGVQIMESSSRRVTVNPLVTCMQCEYCLSGRTNLCPHREIISMPPRPGGFAEYISIPERNIQAIEDNVSFEKAALAEPIAVSWHGVRLASEHHQQNISDTKILILGGGAIGLACALVCRHWGANSIQIAETNPIKHETLSKAGPFKVFNPSHSQPDSLFDLVFDAHGGTQTQQYASQYVRPGGVILNYGLAGGPVGLDVRKMTLQDIAFMGSYTYTEADFNNTVAAINHDQLGKLDWYRAYPLEHGPDLFEQINSGKIPFPKVILNPDG